MKVLIKGIDHSGWVDLSEYLYPPFTITDTVDDTENTCRIVFRFPDHASFPYFNVKEALRPKMLLKITEADEVENETTNNTYLFLTTDSRSVRLRKGNDEVYGIYQHIINGVEYINILDSRYLPHYTITQPKTRYYNIFSKKEGKRFNVNKKFSQNGYDNLNFDEVVGITTTSANNIDNVISFGYDNFEEAYYVEVKDINKRSFNIDLSMSLAKTAVGYIEYKGIFQQTKTTKIKVTTQIDNLTYIEDASEMTLGIKTQYYNGVTLLSSDIKYKTNLYEGGLIPSQQYHIGFQDSLINGFPQITTQTFNINVNKNTLANKARVYFYISDVRVEKNILESGVLQILTEIGGLPNDTYVKTFIESISFYVESSFYETEQEEKYTTLLTFVEKALYDYNINNRYKMKLDNALIPLLSVIGKESEWVDYTLKELLIRAFKYVGLRPILLEDNTITYKMANQETRYIDLEQGQDKETEIIDINFYDKIISNAKNLVSEKDFVTEKIVINSDDKEFSQITVDNAAFTTSNDIYFISNAILYTPGISISGVNSNIGIPFYWNITKRLFEKDLYNSFPDVRYDDLEGRKSRYNARGNTIYYVSGSNIIGGLGHQAPERLLAYNFTGGSIYPAEYAIIEMLVVLALEFDETIATNPSVDYALVDIMPFELEITYVPYYKELTTKFISNMPERIGLNWEKKTNVNERVIGYSELNDILKNEMERKGNVLESYTQIYNSLESSIPNYSIINDNLYITTKAITVMNNYISVDYTLQKNFIYQNEDVSLPVAFERYAIPYEYVNREIFIENHLIFSKERIERYKNDFPGCSVEFLKKILIPQDNLNKIEGMIYGKIKTTFVGDDGNYDSELLMRMTKLENSFNMILAGKFLDNYTAGTQRYSVVESDEFYSQPLSYVKWNGQVDIIKDITIGYDSNKNDRIDLIVLGGNEDYNFNLFPEGTNVTMNTNLYNDNLDHALLKDAREGITLNYSSFLTTETQDIKWYSYKPITHIGFLTKDIVLNDNLKLEDIEMGINTHEIVEILVTLTDYNLYNVEVVLNKILGDQYIYGVVFYNQKVIAIDNSTELVENELVGIIKEPATDINAIVFYIATTKYGKKDNQEDIDQWQKGYFYGKVMIEAEGEVFDEYIEIDDIKKKYYTLHFS